MKVIEIADAEANLSELIEKVQEGKEIIIGQSNEPLAKLVPIALDILNTQPRDMTQRIWVADDGQTISAQEIDTPYLCDKT